MQKSTNLNLQVMNQTSFGDSGYSNLIKYIKNFLSKIFLICLLIM